MGSFETSDRHAHASCQPIRVPILREEVYQAAREMVEDLSGWSLVRADDERLELHCAKKGGLLGGAARITVTVEGPDGIPSATVNVRSETDGGLLARDKANVTEFTVPFHRRVC